MALLLIGLVRKSLPFGAASTPYHRISCKRWDALALRVSSGPVSDEEARIVDWAARQNAVLYECIVAGDVLPVKIGAVFSGPDAVASHVDCHGPAIEDAFDRLAGRVEYAIHIAPASGGGTFTAPSRSDSGTAFLRRRREIRDRRASAAVRRSACIEALWEAIQRPDCRVLRRASRGRDRLEDWAILVPRCGAPAMLEILETWDARVGALGLSLKAIGPWPAFSFLDYAEAAFAA